MREIYKRRGSDPKYPKILADLQRAQVDAFWKISQNGGSANNKQLVMPYINKYLEVHGLQLDEYTQEELSQKLYDDLQGYSVLTEPLEDDNVEGIDVNAWNCIRVKFVNGESQMIDGFNSPQHAISIIQTRLLQSSHQTIDGAVPMAEGSINNNIRITVLMSPLVDEDVGIVCYIRKLKKRVFTEQEYLSGDFTAKKELDLLKIALRRGVSILLVGKVNTGKTTLMSYLLSTLPNDTKIITVEQGARETYLIKRDDKGNIVNNVIHLLTKESRIEDQNITQEKLVEKMLRLNPDVGSVAEMRNTEAYAAQEASLTGHTIISTAHAGSPQQAHKRVASLCRKKYPTDYRVALENACEAFPLVVFIHTLEDNQRRIMNVSECLVDDGKITYRTLWEYQIDENTSDGLSARVVGRHVQVDDVSDALLNRMKMYGISKKEIEAIKK